MFLSEMKTWHFWASVLVELIATFFFVFLTTGTTIAWNVNQPPSTELIALCFGFTIATLAMCNLHLSGGHINPAVSIAMMVIRKVSFPRGLLYVIFQVAGGKCNDKRATDYLYDVIDLNGVVQYNSASQFSSTTFPFHGCCGSNPPQRIKARFVIVLQIRWPYKFDFSRT